MFMPHFCFVTDDYAKARSKLQVAELTSNLESEADASDNVESKKRYV